MADFNKATPRPWTIERHPQEEGTYCLTTPLPDGKPGRRIVASFSAVDPFEAHDSAALVLAAVNAYETHRARTRPGRGLSIKAIMSGWTN